MKALLLKDSHNPKRDVLIIPADGLAPRLFMEWQALSFIELNEVWVIIEYKPGPELDDPAYFLVKFKSTGAAIDHLYDNAREYINSNL